jgi:hypothetical protein
MYKLMASTAIVMGLAASASAQEYEYGYILSSNGIAGTTLAPSGMSSAASIGLSGFGAGGVVVSNSGLQLNLAPEFDADSGFDGSDYETDQSDIDGAIVINNERSVEVSGVLSGIGTLVGTGTTTTTFDAQMIAGAGASTEETEPFEDCDGNFCVYGTEGATSTTRMSGLARLAGESSSTAGMQMVGQTTGFIGEIGTTVGGEFTAVASFDIEDNYFEDGEIETDGTSGINIDATTRDIDLAVASLGGGTMLLQGANSDLFEGGTLLTLDTAFEIGVKVLDFDIEP